MISRPQVLACWFAAFLACPWHAGAQLVEKVYRIGIVLPFDRALIDRKAIPVQRPFEEGLRQLGWTDGRNVQLLWRPRDAVEELVRVPVDVIVTFGTPEVEMKATATIPIVAHITASADHLGIGSAARPAANVTGISVQAHPGLAQKRMELLAKGAGVKRVARFYLSDGGLRFGAASELLPEYAQAARALGIEVFPVWAGTPDEIRAAFRELARRGSVGVMFGAYRRLPGMESTWDLLMGQLAHHRIPSMFDIPTAADEGAMMGYGVNIPERSRRLAYFVDRILRGAKPADLPMEQPVSIEFTVNARAAEAIGVRIPAPVLLQADRVIR